MGKRKVIGLFDYEKTNYPNLALMKLSAWHKERGDTVKLWQGPLSQPYDKIYASKVFTWTKENKYLPKNTKNGGTGFINTKDIKNVLSDSIEHTCPDYSLYPNIKASYGFLTRGCPNKCSWCFVPKKEGTIKKHADIEEFTRHKDVVLMDNNVLAHPWGIQQIEKIIKMGLKIDFNQGMDAKRIDKGIAKLLSKVKWISKIRLACDTNSDIEPIKKAIELLRWYDTSPRNYFVYLLVQDIESALERVKFLKGMYTTPFAQPYRDQKGSKPSRIQKDFARWVNRHEIFFNCTWDEYKRKLGYRI